MLDSFIKSLKEKNIAFSSDEAMSLHTSFKIGGNADIFVCPETEEQLKLVLKAAKENTVPVFILGKGSNLLVSDEGIEGAVVSISCLDAIIADGNEITCGAGAHLSKLCTSALQNSLSGLEFAYGIPGSVGGALYMNAGAYGGEMAGVVKGAYCLNENGESVYISKEDMELGYRTSIFKTNGLIITSVVFALSNGDEAEIKAKMDELMERRKSKQPLEYPSAGSTFKRPEGNFAGTLIEQNGLKGLTVGGAQVSEKHAGFVINVGGATCKDVKELIASIRKTVLENSGVALETEVISVGRGN